ncbi:MAG: hypothetical protein OXC80_01895 [Gammaproteobacteria bacterium]|nr:hypothetical protein [Gammaproteobacteria bacterium]
MPDETLTVKERFAQARYVDEALHSRLADAYAQLGFSDEKIKARLQELVELENDPKLIYPFTVHSAKRAYEREREEALVRGEYLGELKELVPDK